MRINHGLIVFVITLSLGLNVFAADPNDSTSIKPIDSSKVNGQVLVQANMELSLRNIANVSERDTSDPTNNTWLVRYYLCPRGSISSNEVNFTGTEAGDVICKRTGPITRNNITISPYGSWGFELTGQRCVFPVLIWVPGNLVNRGGTVPITLYGRQVNLVLSGTPWIQPIGNTIFSGTINTRVSGIFDAAIGDGAFLNKAVMSPTGNIPENKLEYSWFSYRKC